MTSPSSARQTLGVYAHFFSAYPGRTALMVTLMFLAGVAEGVGVVTLVPVLELADGSSSTDSVITGTVREGLRLVGLSPTLPILLSLIVLAISAKAVLLLLAGRQVGYSVARVVRDLRIDLMRALMGAKWSYFTQKRPGQFANAVATEVLRAAMAYREACSVIAALLQMAAYFLVATLLSVWVALGTLAAGGVLTVIGRVFFVKTRQAGQAQTDGSKELTSRLVDALQGIKPIKAMHREGLVWPLLEHETEILNRAQRKEVMSQQSLKAFQEPILAFALAIGLFLALQISGQPLSAILVLAFIFYRLVTHINTLQMRYQMMLVGESAFHSLREETEDATERREPSGGTRSFDGMTEGILLDNVTFAYGEHVVLRGVTAEIPAGRFVAIHGESGSGKTTLADLLVMLHQPSSGRITVDGVPLQELDVASWRSSVGYVPQEVLLFNDSVLHNITLGDPELTREDAERALKKSGAWDFVASRPEGLDLIIGDRGGVLSGGQRQRLAIARALVANPSLLILDEVTTALDPRTENEICETLRGLAGAVTIFSISHQPAMRAIADIVYEMADGKLEPVDFSVPA